MLSLNEADRTPMTLGAPQPGLRALIAVAALASSLAVVSTASPATGTRLAQDSVAGGYFDATTDTSVDGGYDADSNSLPIPYTKFGFKATVRVPQKVRLSWSIDCTSLDGTTENQTAGKARIKLTKTRRSVTLWKAPSISTPSNCFLNVTLTRASFTTRASKGRMTVSIWGR